MLKPYTKFSVLINQILHDLKDKPWFKMPQPIRGDTSKMDQTFVNRIMVDNGSSVIILQLSIIQKMALENTIKCKVEVLIRFNELTSIAIGTILLDVTSPPIVSSHTFMIVNDPSPHNGILSRPWLVKIGAVTLIKYQKILFRIPE